MAYLKAPVNPQGVIKFVYANMRRFTAWEKIDNTSICQKRWYQGRYTVPKIS